MKQNTSIHETVEIVTTNKEGKDWGVVLGDETLSLLNYLKNTKIDEDSAKTLKEEAYSIFTKCPSPNQKNAQGTGLVCGGPINLDTFLGILRGYPQQVE
jgi:hypothetical protein